MEKHAETRMDAPRKDGFHKLMDDDITLDEYIARLYKAKAIALADLNSFDMTDQRDTQSPGFSCLGVQLCSRDDADAWVGVGNDHYRLFLRFAPDVTSYMREEVEWLLDDGDWDGEPAEDRFYWEVTKYKLIRGKMELLYIAYFSLKGDLLFPECHRDKPLSEDTELLTEGEKYLMAAKDQFFFASNVALPFRPGDILHIDARPFGKPFCAVFGAETDGDMEHYEWTKKEYGYYKRHNFCLYISEDSHGLGITQLDACFTDYIPFPYAPLDRLTVVDHCDDKRLMKASRFLKKNPARFYRLLPQ